MSYHIFKPKADEVSNHEVYFKFSYIGEHPNSSLELDYDTVFFHIGENLYVELEATLSGFRRMDIVNVFKLINFKNKRATFEICDVDLNTEMFNANKFKSAFVKKFNFNKIYNPYELNNGSKTITVEPMNRFMLVCSTNNLRTMIEYKYEYNNIEYKTDNVKSIYYACKHDSSLFKFNIVDGKEVFDSVYYNKNNLIINTDKTDLNLKLFNIEKLIKNLKCNWMDFYPIFYIDSNDGINVVPVDKAKECKTLRNLLKDNFEFFKEYVYDYINSTKYTFTLKDLEENGRLQKLVDVKNIKDFIINNPIDFISNF